MRALCQLILLSALTTPASGQSLQVFGYAGALGEWELTANVIGNDKTKDFSGPLIMTHVGVCTVDGPEEKKGEIRLRLSQDPSRVAATLLIEGVECSYSGRLSDFYNGMMTCPKTQGVPLRLWVK